MPQDRTRQTVGLATLGGTISYVWSHVIWPWLGPIGAPVVTTLLGWADGQPWMFIWVGALVAFAAATTGLVRFEEWRARRRVEHKLALGHCRFATSIREDGYALGVLLINRGEFPIEFEVTDLRTSIDNRVPSRTTPQQRRSVVVDAGGYGWWDDAIVPMTPPKPGTLTGDIEYRVRYGRSEHLKYEIAGRKQVHVTFDEAGKQRAVVWNDVVGSG
jgi:hypothetical protein